MNIRPLFDKVVVEAVTVEEKTKSGFFLPSSAQEKPQTCVVVAVGPGGIVDGKYCEVVNASGLLGERFVVTGQTFVNNGSLLREIKTKQ